MSYAKFAEYDAYKDSGVGWLGDVPEHWEVKRIKDLSRLQSGDSIVSEQIEKEGKYPVYGGNGLRGYYSKYTNNGEYILIGRQGALCGNINYASGKFWASEHAVVTYLKHSIDMKWYGEMLRIMNLNQYSLAAAQPGLAMDRIRRLLLPVPPLTEQKTIAAYLDTKTAQIDRKIGLLTQKATQYGKLKQTLINETVTRGLDKTVAMKDSGVDWMGDVPEVWRVRRLKSLGVIKSSSIDKKDEYEIISLVVHYNDVIKNPIINKNTELKYTSCNKSQFSSFKLHPGDLVITKDSMDIRNIADTSAIDEIKEDTVCGYHLYIFSGKKNLVDYKYYYYCLNNVSLKKYLLALSKGTTIIGLSGASLLNNLVPFPPLLEQKAIADYLDTKTAHIDRIVETTNIQIEKLKELRKTLINDVVTGKIKVA